MLKSSPAKLSDFQNKHKYDKITVEVAHEENEPLNCQLVDANEGVVQVKKVSAGSLLNGKIQKGDYILSINDKMFKNKEELFKIAAKSFPQMKIIIARRKAKKPSKKPQKKASKTAAEHTESTSPMEEDSPNAASPTTAPKPKVAKEATAETSEPVQKAKPAKTSTQPSPEPAVQQPPLAAPTDVTKTKMKTKKLKSKSKVTAKTVSGEKAEAVSKDKVAKTTTEMTSEPVSKKKVVARKAGSAESQESIPKKKATKTTPKVAKTTAEVTSEPVPKKKVAASPEPIPKEKVAKTTTEVAKTTMEVTKTTAEVTSEPGPKKKVAASPEPIPKEKVAKTTTEISAEAIPKPKVPAKTVTTENYEAMPSDKTTTEVTSETVSKPTVAKTTAIESSESAPQSQLSTLVPATTTVQKPETAIQSSTEPVSVAAVSVKSKSPTRSFQLGDIDPRKHAASKGFEVRADREYFMSKVVASKAGKPLGLGIMRLSKENIIIISSVQPNSVSFDVFKPGDRLLTVNDTAINDVQVCKKIILDTKGDFDVLFERPPNGIEFYGLEKPVNPISRGPLKCSYRPPVNSDPDEELGNPLAGYETAPIDVQGILNRQLPVLMKAFGVGTQRTKTERTSRLDRLQIEHEVHEQNIESDVPVGSILRKIPKRA